MTVLWPLKPYSVIVSVQASGGEPFSEPAAKHAMMQSVVDGGAHGLRLADVDDIGYARAQWPALPIIGITKPDPLPEDWKSMVYITPTLDDMVAVAQAGATVVAIDGTQRPRPDQLTLTLEKFRVLCPNTPVMADCDTLLSALAAEAAGLDAIATTLSGYTQESLQDKASLYTPDWALLYQLSQHSRIPIVMEGRLWEPVHVTKAFRLGASAVVIGSAITRPHEVTRRFLTGANGFA